MSVDAGHRAIGVRMAHLAASERPARDAAPATHRLRGAEAWAMPVSPVEPLDDLLGDLSHARTPLHRLALDETEGFGFRHPLVLLEQALGALDQLAGLETTLQIVHGRFET